jgi:FlaA1/EpsC-like NDP-sugar epimerase
MTPTLDQLAPGLVAKLNLVMDLLLLGAALKLAGCDLGSAAVLAGVGGWLGFGVALSHYEANAYARARGLEVCIVALIAAVSLTCATLALRQLEVDLVAAAVMCAFAATLLRLSLFRALAKGTATRQEVVIVGAGSLALETARRARKSQRQKLLGLLPFAGENLRALPELGRAMELEKVLRRMPVDEVYIAGDVLTQGAEMRRAVSVCERLGVPFALPLSGFMFNRAHAVTEPGASVGYVHYLGVEMKEPQR